VRKRRDELLERGKVNPLRRRAHDEQDADRLLQSLVWDAEGECRADAGVAAGASEDGVLDLARRDDLAATVDGLLAAAGDIEVAVVVEVAQVARLLPVAPAASSFPRSSMMASSGPQVTPLVPARERS